MRAPICGHVLLFGEPDLRLPKDAATIRTQLVFLPVVTGDSLLA